MLTQIIGVCGLTFLTLVWALCRAAAKLPPLHSPDAYEHESAAWDAYFAEHGDYEPAGTTVSATERQAS